MDKPRCTATVFTRDDYRYSGAGASGFSMHYSQSQCTRSALPGKPHCWQHDADESLARMHRAHAKRLAKWRRLRDQRDALKPTTGHSKGGV